MKTNYTNYAEVTLGKENGRWVVLNLGGGGGEQTRCCNKSQNIKI